MNKNSDPILPFDITEYKPEEGTKIRIEIIPLSPFEIVDLLIKNFGKNSKVVDLAMATAYTDVQEKTMTCFIHKKSGSTRACLSCTQPEVLATVYEWLRNKTPTEGTLAYSQGNASCHIHVIYPPEAYEHGDVMLSTMKALLKKAGATQDFGLDKAKVLVSHKPNIDPGDLS